MWIYICRTSQSRSAFSRPLIERKLEISAKTSYRSDIMVLHIYICTYI